MATLVMRNAYVLVNGTDLTTAVKEARLEMRTEVQDETAMGDNFRTRKPGLGDWSVSLVMNQDRITGSVDDVFFSLIGPDASTFYVALNPSGSTTSQANKRYSGPVVLESYQPFQGSIGELETVQASLVGAGTLQASTS